jgi:hypothetical protein
VADARDNCVGIFNPTQDDPTGAGIGSSCPIVPSIDCVDFTNGIAFFGYHNNDNILRSLDVGKFNAFSPAPADRAQPSAFAAGVQVKAFQVPFSGTPLIWTLNGQSVTASNGSPSCALIP